MSGTLIPKKCYSIRNSVCCAYLVYIRFQACLLTYMSWSFHSDITKKSILGQQPCQVPTNISEANTVLKFVNNSFQTQIPQRNQLDNVRQEICLRATTSQVSPHIKIAGNNMRCPFSHWSPFSLNSSEEWINKCKRKDKEHTTLITSTQLILFPIYYKRDKSKGFIM